MEEKKTKSTGKTVAIVILIILLVASLGFIGYDKFLVKKNDETAKEEIKNNTKDDKTIKSETLEVTDSTVQKLFNIVNSGVFKYCGVEEYYTNSKITSNNIDNQLAYQIALSKIYNYEDSSILGKEFKAETLEKAIASIFGKDYKFKNDTYGECDHIYDQATNTYKINENGGCGGTCGPAVVYKRIVKAEKTNNTIELSIRVLFPKVNDNKKDEYGNSTVDFYGDYARTKLLDYIKLDDYTPNMKDSNFTEGALYKMIFTKEGNDYIFTSSEPVSKES